MSQFPNQQPNQSIDYQQRKVFETPQQPGVFQEQVPIFPSPNVRVGYKGINLAELGVMAAKAGMNIAEAAFKYQADQKEVALESLVTDHKVLTEQMYRDGATQEELDSKRAELATKIRVLGGVDEDGIDEAGNKISESDLFNAEGVGHRPAKLLVASRNALASVDSNNAKYLDTQRATELPQIGDAAVMKVGEAIAANPADIAAYDQGISSIDGILRVVLGLDKNAPLSSDNILAIKNPVDRGIAMKLYTDKVKLLSDRNKTAADLHKASASYEEDTRKANHANMRDEFKKQESTIKTMQAELIQLKDIPAEQKTPETRDREIALTHEFLQIVADLDGYAAAMSSLKPNVKVKGAAASVATNQWGIPVYTAGTEDKEIPALMAFVDRRTQPNNLPPEYDNTLESDFFNEAVIGEAAVESPPLREAYSGLVQSIGAFKNTVGDVGIKMNAQFAKDSVTYIKKLIEAKAADLGLAISGSSDISRDAPRLRGDLRAFQSATLDLSLGHLGEARIQQLYDTVIKPKATISTVDGGKLTAGTYQEEAAKGYPFLKALLDFESPAEQMGLIHTIFNGNSQAFTSWQEASEAFKKLHESLNTKQFGSSGSGGTRSFSRDDALGLLVGNKEGLSIPPSQLTGHSDAVVSDMLSGGGPAVDLSSPQAVMGALRKKGSSPEGLPLGVLQASTVVDSIFKGTTTAEELTDILIQLSPKDASGAPILFPPGNWTKHVGATSFPAWDTVIATLNTADPNSEAYKKGLVMFSILPAEWRSQVMGAVGPHQQLVLIDDALRANPGLNVATLQSIAKQGSHADDTIKRARDTAKFNSDSLLKTRKNPEDFNEESEDLAVFNEKISMLGAVTKALNDPVMSGMGFRPKATVSDYLFGPNYSPQAKNIFGWFVEETTFNHELGVSKGMTWEQASAKAMARFNAEYVIKAGAMFLRKTLKTDELGDVIFDSPDFKNLIPLTVDRNPLSRIWNYDTTKYLVDSDAEIRRLPEQYSRHETGWGATQKNLVQTPWSPAISFPKDKPRAFADAVMHVQTQGGGLSPSNRAYLSRLMPKDSVVPDNQREGAMLGHLIETTMLNSHDTSAGSILTAVATLNSLQRSMEKDPTAFDTWEEVVAHTKSTALKIKQSIKAGQYRPNTDQEYSFAVTTEGIKSKRGKDETTYGLQILQKNPDGGYTRLARTTDNLNFVGQPGNDLRGLRPDVDMLSRIPSKDLYNLPQVALTARIQELYDKGLLSSPSFEYRILGDLGDGAGSKYFSSSPGSIPTLRVRYDERSKKVVVNRYSTGRTQQEVTTLMPFGPPVPTGFRDTTTQLSEEKSLQYTTRDEAANMTDEDVDSFLLSAASFAAKEDLVAARLADTGDISYAIDVSRPGTYTPPMRLLYYKRVDPHTNSPAVYAQLQQEIGAGGWRNTIDSSRLVSLPERTFYKKPEEHKLTANPEDASFDPVKTWQEMLSSQDNGSPTEYTQLFRDMLELFPQANTAVSTTPQQRPHASIPLRARSANTQDLYELGPTLEYDPSFVRSVVGPNDNPYGPAEQTALLNPYEENRQWHKDLLGKEHTEGLLGRAEDENQTASPVDMTAFIKSRMLDFLPKGAPSYKNRADAQPPLPSEDTTNVDYPRSAGESKGMRALPQQPPSPDHPQIYTRDGVDFKYRGEYTLKELYEATYGLEGTKKRFEQATERQKASPQLGLAVPAKYDSQAKVPVYYYNGPEGSTLAGVDGLTLTQTDGKVLILLDKPEGLSSGTLEHEAYHALSPRGRMMMDSITPAEARAMSEDERYVLSRREFPAWIADLKAKYFLTTNNELFPNSPEKDYGLFVDWLGTQIKDPKTGDYIKAIHKVLTEEGPRKEGLNEVLRQVAMDIPDRSEDMRLI